MELPNKLESVIADIRHQSETGKHQWYEVVYHDGNKWCCYAGSDTFRDGESVKQWKYTKDIFISSQLEPPVMQKNTEMMIGQYGLKWKDEDYLIVTKYYEDGYCHEWEICGGDMETVLQVLSITTKHDYKKDDKSVFSA